MNESEIILSNIKEIIDFMNPVEIWVNGVLKWEDGDSYEKYLDVFNVNKYVNNLAFEIVDFHHAIVKIYLC